jgi:hypothetical protein
MRTNRQRRGAGVLGAGLAAVLAAVGLAGCTRGPAAPALDNEPVYKNSAEGFRFLVPEGWIQRAKAEVPSGRVAKERLLVRYDYRGSDRPAVLEVSLVDLPATTDLTAYLAAASYGVRQWKPASKQDAIEVEGSSGTRWSFTGTMADHALNKEVTVFRRGERSYLFTCLYYADDAAAREQARRAIASTMWQK